MEKVRQIIYFKDYFLDFFNEQTEKVKEKIDYILFVITVAERIPKKFFEHITGTNGLYEIRVEFQSNIYRIFCCFDEGKLIVLLNGFQKKTQKTPQVEIDKALKIKNEYFSEKLKKQKNEIKEPKNQER
jgi:phage-related protein